MSKIAAIILAAGKGERMPGGDKMLQSFRGKPLLSTVIEAARRSRADPVSVVTGHAADRLAPLLDQPGLTHVANPDYAEGISSSLKAGISALPDEVDGALICLGDMPLVTDKHLNTLIEAFSGTVCAPTYQGRRGNPVLWGRKYFAELLELTGDKGARDLLKRYNDELILVEMPDDGILIDIDTPDALEKLQ